MDEYIFIDLTKLRPRNIDVIIYNEISSPVTFFPQKLRYSQCDLMNQNTQKDDMINDNILPLRNRSPIPMKKVIFGDRPDSDSPSNSSRKSNRKFSTGSVKKDIIFKRNRYKNK